MASSVDDLIKLLYEAGLLPEHERLRLENMWGGNQTLKTLGTLADQLESTAGVSVFLADEIRQGHLDRLVIGDYLLLDRIGKGGMGDVYKARHLLMKRDVALKLILASRDQHEEAIQRFKRELRTAARFMHANIVTALDAGHSGGHYYLVMELIEGRDLQRLIRKQGPLPAAEALDCIRQAALGLEYAQQFGLVHRDIKPGNLVRSPSGNVKILDWGLSRLQTAIDLQNFADDDETVTRDGQMLGTSNFMSPEQALHPTEVDLRADIYSLGCTFYFLVIGWPPYRRPTAMEQVIAHREAAIPSLVEARPELPRAVDALFRKMVAKDPADRFQSYKELLGAIDQCLAELTSPAVQLDFSGSSAGAHATTRWAMPTPRNQTLALLAGAVLVAALAVGGGVYFSRPRTTDERTASPTQPGPSAAPAESATADPPAIAVQLLDPQQPTDVFPGLTLGEAEAEAGWQLGDGALTVPAGNPQALLPVGRFETVPPAYTVALEVRRLSGKGPFLMGLPHASGAFLVMLDRLDREGARRSFIGFDQQDRTVTSLANPPPIGADAVQIRCEVGPNGVTVAQNGQPVFQWSGSPTQLKLAAGWTLPHPGAVFVASNNSSSFHVRSLTITPAAPHADVKTE